MSNFQNGGSKGKGVVDNLFLLRALIDHLKYMGKQLWLTFYNIEKCFDSLWLEDCINSLRDNGVKDDTLSLIYNLNVKANITIKTPFGDTQVLSLKNLVKQGTVLGPVLNNCSLDRVCKESLGYHIGSVEIKSMEFVDDIADPNSDEISAKFSNRIVEQIQFEKRLTLSAEKCELLKINSKCNGENLTVNNEKIKLVNVAKYLGDSFNSKGSYADLCKERVDRARGSTHELLALCREVTFGTQQIETMLILYQSIFLPRLIYNCESWSNLKTKDYQALQSVQLSYLRSVMEVPGLTPIAALFLELSVLPIKFEIEQRQLFFLKRILDKDPDDPVHAVYKEQLNYNFEENWANYIFQLRHTYNLPLNDENIKKMTLSQWKSVVKSAIRQDAFMQLTIQCANNRKTSHLKYESFVRASYLKKLDPSIARVIFKARTRMFDIKVNYKRKYKFSVDYPFCKYYDETFDHIFKCNSGVFRSRCLYATELVGFCSESSIPKVWKIGIFLENIPNIEKKCYRCTFQIFGEWQGRRTSHLPPSLPPPLIFKAKLKIFVTLPS